MTVTLDGTARRSPSIESRSGGGISSSLFQVACSAQRYRIPDQMVPLQLIRLVHPSVAGGTSTCAWAQELARRNESTGIRTFGKLNCNSPCTMPPWNSVFATALHASCKRGHSCAEFKHSVGNVTWVQVENGLTLREWPCSGVLDAMLLRNPWDRIVHALNLRHMGKNDRAKSCTRLMTRPDRIDNLYTRSLLGLPLTAERGVAVGAVNDEHLAKARRMLSEFVVIPTHNMSGGFTRLIKAVERWNQASGVVHWRVEEPLMAIHSHKSAAASPTHTSYTAHWLGIEACESLHARFSQINWVDNALYQDAMARLLP
jgi:hypothetical protein